MPLPNPTTPQDVSACSPGAWAERYARQIALAGFGQPGQEALARARVLVVGAGGLGSPVIAYLAAAGVGTVGIVDDDVVELSNLHRQVVHAMADVGRPKTSSAARFAAELNPQVNVVEHAVRLDADSALTILPQYDLVLDGSDNFTTRYLLNDVCVLLGLPLVWASISDFTGQLGVVVPQVGPCYRCIFPSAPASGTVVSCEQGGVLGVLPGVMGTLQATEAIKTITGLGALVSGGLLMYDALAARTDLLPVARDPRCVSCGQPAEGAELRWGVRPDAVREVRGDDLAASGERLLVDVREPDEAAGLPWPGSVLCAWSQWTGATVEQLVRMSRDAPGGVVVGCAGGVRSHAAAVRLLAAGADTTQVASLRGGLTAFLRGEGA